MPASASLWATLPSAPGLFSTVTRMPSSKAQAWASPLTAARVSGGRGGDGGPERTSPPRTPLYSAAGADSVAFEIPRRRRPGARLRLHPLVQGVVPAVPAHGLVGEHGAAVAPVHVQPQALERLVR